MWKYEQSTRAAVTFFSLLVGLSLKHLLEQSFPPSSSLGANRWACFLIGVALLLRYVVGSMHHLWFEYVRSDPGPHGDRWFLFDLAFLMVFGVLAVCAYFDETLRGLLLWLLALAAAAVVWGLVDLLRSTRWVFWLVINLAQLTAVGGTMLGIERTPTQTGIWLRGLVGVSVLLLFEDLRRQLRAIDLPRVLPLEPRERSEPREKSDPPRAISA